MSTPLNKQQWARDFLIALGNANPLPLLVAFVWAWEEEESGANDITPADYNPLNTTQTMKGSTNFNDAGVQNFLSYADGITANMSVLKNGLYPNILEALSTNDASPLQLPSVAGDLSMWATGKREPVDESYVSSIVEIMLQLAPELLPSKPWFMFPVSVPFGNPNYDSQYGGSHDMDVSPPPNYPVTNLLPGTISSISSPSWGKAVGLKLDVPLGDVAYWSFLHLSAVNPALQVGQHLNTGDLVGWVGGATSQSQYNGTSNPTGQNFLNDPSQSSQVQVGFALMRGPEYGVGSGWETFPPIDKTLDPTEIINAAIQKVLGSPDFVYQSALDTWNASAKLPQWNGAAPSTNTNMFASYLAEYRAGRNRGVPIVGWNSVDYHGNKIAVLQCAYGRAEDSNGVIRWYD